MRNSYNVHICAQSVLTKSPKICTDVQPKGQPEKCYSCAIYASCARALSKDEHIYTYRSSVQCERAHHFFLTKPCTL